MAQVPNRAKQTVREANDEERTCRICFGEEERESLIAPCACRGSMQYVHADCLREWIAKTQNLENRRTCGQCKASYKVRRGIWASRRRVLRVLLAAMAFSALSLFLATFLPWNAQCLNAAAHGIPHEESWWTWDKRVLFFLPPDLIDRVEKLKWVPGDGGVLTCRRLGRWHLDAALLYGSVKVSGIGLNVYCAHKLLEWMNDGEIALPVLFFDRICGWFHVDVNVFDYANHITGVLALVWWWTVSPWMWGYMPTAGDGLIQWGLYQAIGCYSVMVFLKNIFEDAEMQLLDRLGGLRKTDLLIFCRLRRSYH